MKEFPYLCRKLTEGLHIILAFILWFSESFKEPSVVIVALFHGPLHLVL
jgi:hypothetical protein